MIALLWFILLLSIFLIVFNYLVYPWMLSLFSRGKDQSGVVYGKSELPRIAIVFAAYNEEKVVEAKLANLNTLDYPTDLLDIHIGLDHPDDETASLIEANRDIKFPVFVHHFKERSGKANVLNKLFNKSLNIFDYKVLVMMDANVISKQNSLIELVKHFKNEQIGLVGAVIENSIDGQTEIANQEKYYIGKESQIKVNEGLLFKSTIGAFGACYAIRPKHIKEIPSNFLMEDFYLSMNVLEQDAHCITNPNAVVFEDLPGTIREEFKRKRRISTGNFQNLKSYFHFLWKKPISVSFPFFAHKVLRWLSPFFMLIAIISCTILFFWESNTLIISNAFPLISVLFFLMLVNIILPILDIVLQAVNINVNLLRLHRYFILMNIAMFLGFIDWVKGVKTNIWKPTERL